MRALPMRRACAAPGVAIKCTKQTCRRINHQQHHQQRLGDEVIAARVIAQPFGSSTAIKRPRKGPRKKPEPPTITISSWLKECDSANGLGSMNFDQRRIENAGDAAHGGPDGEGHQRITCGCRRRAMPRAPEFFAPAP